MTWFIEVYLLALIAGVCIIGRLLSDIKDELREIRKAKEDEK